MAVAPDIRIRYDFPYVAAMPQILLSPENPYASSVLYRATWDNDDSSTSAQSLLTPGGEQGRDTPAESRQSASYLLPYFAAELAEPHLSSVFISDFTLVCRDESLLKKLLKSYFLHDYETFGVFHKDIFLAAMKTGDQRFCTPMLVNAILAKATVGPPCSRLSAPC
jgi:hypothetical protein